MLHRLLIPLDLLTTSQTEHQLREALEHVPGVVVVFNNPQTEMLYLVYQDQEIQREELDRVLHDSGLLAPPPLAWPPLSRTQGASSAL